MVDAAIIIIILSAAAGLLFRACHEEKVSDFLTDPSRREDLYVTVALPNPWRRDPLFSLPVAGDSMAGAGGRDFARFIEIDTSGETHYPTARFMVRARVDDEGRAWFDYASVAPGASFAFHTPRYRMEGLILKVDRKP